MERINACMEKTRRGSRRILLIRQNTQKQSIPRLIMVHLEFFSILNFYARWVGFRQKPFHASAPLEKYRYQSICLLACKIDLWKYLAVIFCLSADPTLVRLDRDEAQRRNNFLLGECFQEGYQLIHNDSTL